jgi:hypothetical protein
MTLYKITDKNDCTWYGSTQWGEGVTNTADGKGSLCTKHWIHAYRDLYFGILMNPVHGNYEPETMHIWKSEGKIGIDDNTKVGCTSLTTLHRIDVPTITIEQKVKIAIRCACAVYKDLRWIKWANEWESGKDRSLSAIWLAQKYSEDSRKQATNDLEYKAAKVAMYATLAASNAISAVTKLKYEEFVKKYSTVERYAAYSASDTTCLTFISKYAGELNVDVPAICRKVAEIK